MSQQLSTKVALVLKKRFNEIYSGKPTAEKVRNTSFETLKSIGLSTSKANTIIEIANYAETPGLSKQKMVRSSNEGVIAHVIPIKGVGKWTAEMMLMFCLSRPDIIAVDDLGIQKGMKQLFGWEDIPRKELCTKMVEEAEKWSPFRTYACMYIWRMLDSA